MVIALDVDEQEELLLRAEVVAAEHGPVDLLGTDQPCFDMALVNLKLEVLTHGLIPLAQKYDLEYFIEHLRLFRLTYILLLEHNTEVGEVHQEVNVIALENVFQGFLDHTENLGQSLARVELMNIFVDYDELLGERPLNVFLPGLLFFCHAGDVKEHPCFT